MVGRIFVVLFYSVGFLSCLRVTDEVALVATKPQITTSTIQLGLNSVGMDPWLYLN